MSHSQNGKAQYVLRLQVRRTNTRNLSMAPTGSTESSSQKAHLIWKLRNERLFKYQSENEWPQQPEIHNRWLTIINAKLTLDRSVRHTTNTANAH